MTRKVKDEEVLDEEIEETQEGDEVEEDDEDKPKKKAKKDNDDQGIEVGDPMLLRPVELPLVVKLPEGASKAQVAYAAILNSYAYQNPTKWELKKGKMIQKLKDLKFAPDPVESKLKVNNSGL